MLRVVLDTNVLVSAVHFGGTPASVLSLAVEGQFLPVTSAALLTELSDVLRSKFRYPPDMLELVMTEWKAMALVTEPRERLSIIAEDPSDNRVLACALSAHAQMIVSGDRHLLALKRFRVIPILSPREFLERSFPHV